MLQINCYLPIKLRIVGELSDAQLEQLGQTLARTLQARLEQARRTLSEHGYAPLVETVALAREHVDQARLSKGRYGLPSYDQGGKAVGVPVTSDTETQLEEMLRGALDYWEEQSKDLPSADERARARRIFILLGLGQADPFKNASDIDRFIDSCIKTANDEDDTLQAAEQLTDREALLFDEGAAFPNAWAWRVRGEFSTSADLNALQRVWESARSDMRGHAAYLSAEVWDRGLPLSKAEASTLRLNNLLGRTLDSERAKIPSKDILIQYTQALLRFERATAHYWLVHGYKQQFDGRVESIRKGDLIIDKNEYEALKGAKKVFQFKLHAFENATSSNDISKAISALLLWDPAKFNRLYFVGWQDEGVHTLWAAIAQVDARIKNAGKFECIWRALVWAEERDYFAAAGKEVYEAIKDNWLKMIGTLVAIIVAQAIPGLNVAVDLILLIKFGFDGVQAAVDLGGALKDAGGANSVVELEHASARLASVLVGLAADIALWAATWGTVKAAKELVQWRKVEKFVKEYGDNTETREILRKTKGNAEEAEKILKTKREHERQERELQQAEQRRQAAEADRQRKLEEEAAKGKQEKKQKPWEEEEAEAIKTVAAKRKQKKGAAKQDEPLEGGKGKPPQGPKPGEKRDFVAEYDNAQEALRTARNEVASLEQQLRELKQKGAFSGKRALEEDLTEGLEGARQRLSHQETAAVQAEKALRESSLELHEKLGAAARNRKGFRDVVRLANGEDKVGGFKVDLTKDHIAPDHIVAIRRITTDPRFRGFEKLSWEDQLEIVNLPDNLVAMKGSFNSSKGARPWSEWNQARQYYGSKVVDGMIAREARAEQLIVNKIAERLKAAPRKGL